MFWIVAGILAVIVLTVLFHRKGDTLAKSIATSTVISCAFISLIGLFVISFAPEPELSPAGYTREVEANIAGIEDEYIVVLEKDSLRPRFIDWKYVNKIEVWDDKMLELGQEMGDKLLFSDYTMNGCWANMSEYSKIANSIGGNLDYLPAVSVRYGKASNELLWRLFYLSVPEVCRIDFVPSSYVEAALGNVDVDARGTIEDKLSVWGSGDGSGRYGWLYSPTSVEQERKQAEELLAYQKAALSGVVEQE